MKTIIFLLLLAATQISFAKESREADEAIKRYQSKEPSLMRISATPQAALVELVTKMRDPSARKTTVKEVFSVLTIARDLHDKALISQLKELWKIHQKSTFRVIFGKGWRSVKSRDYSQEICDEIKILIKNLGGSTNDLMESFEHEAKLTEK